MFSLRSILPILPALLVMLFMLSPSFTVVVDSRFVPAWVENKNSCLLFQLAYNRTYLVSTEMGQTTDFNYPWECVRWCGWVQACKGILFEYVITTAYGGCYDIQGPCCKIYSYTYPTWGVPESPMRRDSAIYEWYPQPLPRGLQCPEDEYDVLDMEPYYGLPHIWYDGHWRVYGTLPLGYDPEYLHAPSAPDSSESLFARTPSEQASLEDNLAA